MISYPCSVTLRQNACRAGLESEFSASQQMINKTRTAVAHGGNPQDRAASPTKRLACVLIIKHKIKLFGE